MVGVFGVIFGILVLGDMSELQSISCSEQGLVVMGCK